MFVRNLLQAGDNVTIIPQGIRITLQYGETGQLESVYTGYEDDKYAHPELLVPLVSSGEVPSRISVNKGTTFVFGCLYTSNIYKVEGLLYESVETIYLNHYIEDKSSFHFFAGHMESYALSLNSPITIQRWLRTAKFNTLPSYIVPANLREDTFSSMLNLSKYTFDFPRILGYIIFRGNDHKFLYTNLKQIVVKHIQKIVSSEGFILAELESYDLGKFLVSYADVVNRNIHENTILLLNDDGDIVYSYNEQGMKISEYGRTMTCEYCGKIIEVPAQSVKFTCSDPHCVSVLYPRVSRMLNKLKLPSVDIIRLKEFAKGFNNIVSLPDVLDMKEYQNEMVEVRLPDILDASVPSNVITRYSDWNVFCNACNNSIESVLYYLQNPGRIIKDLKLDPAIYRRFVTWLADNDNMLDVVGMFNHSRVSILTSGKKFEGAPIFRGKTIYLTGKFNHGSFEDVKAILSSYSAEVYENFNTAIDCVIIGGLHEGVSGKDVKRAKSMDIPVFEEEDFFRQYEIDEDISQSLRN